MRRQPSSIDGILRTEPAPRPIGRQSYTARRSPPKQRPTTHTGQLNLRPIPQRKKPATKSTPLLQRKGVKQLAMGMLSLLLFTGGYLAIKAAGLTNSMFEGSVAGVFDSEQPLQTDAGGNTNILLFGNTADNQRHIDTGTNQYRTDSILIASINQDKEKAALLSVPRDLWVQYGEVCSNGSEGKINAVFMCGSNDGEDHRAGAQMLLDTISKNFEIDMHYYVSVNTTAVKEAVDAVGGIEVVIDSSDPRGVYDPAFDHECHYQCNFVRHPNGPVELNGQEALFLARARNNSGQGYGLSGGNFAREQHQRQIIVALRDRAMSAGVLSSPSSVSGLVDSLGNNVRTNFQTNEIRTLMRLGRSIDKNNVVNLSLTGDSTEADLVTTDFIYGESIVRPTAGIYEFYELQDYLTQSLKPATPEPELEAL